MTFAISSEPKEAVANLEVNLLDPHASQKGIRMDKRICITRTYEYPHARDPWDDPQKPETPVSVSDFVNEPRYAIVCPQYHDEVHANIVVFGSGLVQFEHYEIITCGDSMNAANCECLAQY